MSWSARWRWSGTLVLLVLVPAGCRRTYQTTAVYEATAGGYRTLVTSAGSFSADYDLNPVPTGRATITPLEEGTRPAILIELPGNATARYKVGKAGFAVAPWGSLDTLPTLNAILSVAGYASLNDDEQEEMARAIEGVTYGPKGTVLPGPGGVLRIRGVTIR